MAAMALTAGAAYAAPSVKPLEVTRTSFIVHGQTVIQQFDPKLGILISAQATTFGLANYTAKGNAPLTKDTPYAYKANFFIHCGQASLHVPMTGSTTLTAFKPDYSFSAKGSGGEAVTPPCLNALKGTGVLTLGFTADLPSPPPPLPGGPGTATVASTSGTLSVTFRYQPSLKLPQNPKLPKQPIPKLPK